MSGNLADIERIARAATADSLSYCNRGLMEQRVVAEIIGPAGAGKSTLSRALRERDGGRRTGLSVWGLPPLLLATNAFTSLPILVGFYRGGRRLSWGEVNLVIRLNALHQLLGRVFQARPKALRSRGTVFASSSAPFPGAPRRFRTSRRRVAVSSLGRGRAARRGHLADARTSSGPPHPRGDSRTA